jgi:hypothetical protein
VLAEIKTGYRILGVEARRGDSEHGTGH